jgi:hypothetical protein
MSTHPLNGRDGGLRKLRDVPEEGGGERDTREEGVKGREGRVCLDVSVLMIKAKSVDVPYPGRK